MSYWPFCDESVFNVLVSSERWSSSHCRNMEPESDSLSNFINSQLESSANNNQESQTMIDSLANPFQSREDIPKLPAVIQNNPLQQNSKDNKEMAEEGQKSKEGNHNFGCFLVAQIRQIFKNIKNLQKNKISFQLMSLGFWNRQNKKTMQSLNQLFVQKSIDPIQGKFKKYLRDINHHMAKESDDSLKELLSSCKKYLRDKIIESEEEMLHLASKRQIKDKWRAELYVSRVSEFLSDLKQNIVRLKARRVERPKKEKMGDHPQNSHRTANHCKEHKGLQGYDCFKCDFQSP